MNEQKNCPFLILLLLSVIVLTVAGSLEPKGGDAGEYGLAVSYGGSGVHSIAVELDRMGEAFAEGQSFQQAYEEMLNRSLPVARILHSVKNGGLLKNSLQESQAVAALDANLSGKGQKAAAPDEAGGQALPADVLPQTDAKSPVNPGKSVGRNAAKASDANVPAANVPDAAGLALDGAEAQTPDVSDGRNSQPVFGTVGREYFDDAVFIGDSRIVGLSLYSGWENATFLAARGMEVYSFLTKKYVSVGSVKMTVPEALAGRRFGKVYLMLGINELGSGDQDTFIGKYREILGVIRSLQPDAQIYVMGILHVDEKKFSFDPVFNNENIGERNRRLKLLAEELGFLYLDVNEVSCDENGFIPAEYTADGVHLKAKYISLWTDYLLTHAVTPPPCEPDSGMQETAASVR